ncbi:MAG: hypothetical protein JWQ95_7138 [Sphaerisporangium sp.]|jgi:hypothetical protein|nr:hypothetical protein [Sphaerisporangium sp.]
MGHTLIACHLQILGHGRSLHAELLERREIHFDMSRH